MGIVYRSVIFFFVLGAMGCPSASVMKKPPQTLAEECKKDPTMPACKYLKYVPPEEFEKALSQMAQAKMPALGSGRITCDCENQLQKLKKKNRGLLSVLRKERLLYSVECGEVLK